MEITLGEDEAFTAGTVQELLEIAKENLQRDLREQIKTEVSARGEAERQREELRRTNRRNRAVTWARKTARVFTSFIRPGFRCRIFRQLSSGEPRNPAFAHLVRACCPPGSDCFVRNRQLNLGYVGRGNRPLNRTLACEPVRRLAGEGVRRTDWNVDGFGKLGEAFRLPLGYEFECCRSACHKPRCP